MVTNIGLVTLANGEIEIVADSLFNEGTIVTETFNNTESGDINIEAAQDVVISNRGQIKTTTFSAGNAGNINLNIQRLSIREINQNPPSLFGINSLTSANSTGNTGNIIINAIESVEIIGDAPLPEAIGLAYLDNYIISGSTISISTIAFGIGDAGDISVDTGKLLMQNGAAIGTDPIIFGEGGDININAEDIFLEGLAAIAAITHGFGNSGEVIITNSRMELINGASIISESLPLNTQLTEDVNNLNIPEFNLDSLDPFTLSLILPW